MTGQPLAGRPRYSERALPPYSYVPGWNAHPVSDPRGHMYGHTAPPAKPISSDAYRQSSEYLYGVDLFNHGFYWEAHEAWESLWHAAGRHGPLALWLKALIKLAAAGVKLREGNPRGVLRHSRRAGELLRELSAAIATESQEDVAQYCGIDRSAAAQLADTLASQATPDLQPDPDRVVDRWLTLAIPS